MRQTSSPTLLARGLRFALQSPDRRSVAAGGALALVVWLLAVYGVQSATSLAMALVVVICGGTAAVLAELDGHCARLRLKAREALPVARRWVCLQGAALLATLLALGALG